MERELTRCQDCDGTTSAGFFQEIGNGRCSHCHGAGKIYDVVGALAAPFVDCNTYTRCDVCSGTGQCQRCGGNGEIYDNGSNSNENYDRHNDSGNTSDSSYYNYSPGSSGNSSPHKKPVSGDDYGWLIIIAVVIGLVVLFKHLDNFPATYTVTPPQQVQPTVTVTPSNPQPINPSIQSDQQVTDGDSDYPDAEEIKSDLIGNTMPRWRFASLTEFKDFKILNRSRVGDTLYVTVKLKLKDEASGKIFGSEISVLYYDGDKKWEFVSINQQSYSEISSDYSSPISTEANTNNDEHKELNNETAVPHISQHYEFVDNPGYNDYGAVIFWTTCPNCGFEVRISGQRFKVRYSQEAPTFPQTNSDFGMRMLASALYDYTIYDRTGHPYRFNTTVKTNNCLFICINKRDE